MEKEKEIASNDFSDNGVEDQNPDNDNQVIRNENADEVKQGSNIDDANPDVGTPKVSYKPDEAKEENSGIADEKKKYADSNVPSNVQSGQNEPKQEINKPSQAECDEESFQSSKEKAKSISKPMDNESAAASEWQSNQKSIDTCGSKSCFYNNGEFIRKEQPTLKKIKQLNLSAQFIQAGMEIVLNNNGCLLIVDGGFVAKVKIEQPKFLDEVRNFQQAKEFIFNQIKIVRVLVNRDATMLAKCRDEVLNKVEYILKHSTSDRRRGVACIQMLRLVKKYSKKEDFTFINFFQQIIKNTYLHDELKDLIKIVKELEKRVCKRVQLLKKFGFCQKDDLTFLYNRMQKATAESMKNHKRALMEITPASLKSQLEKNSRDQFMLITVNDMKRFADMRSVLSKEIFSKPLQDMEHRWIRQIESMKTNSTNKGMKITNDMFFFVCKSLQELILEISELTGHEVESLLKCTNSGWRPISKINWKEENLLTKCLERQYFFMFRLLTHFAFSPKYGKKPFEYKFQYLANFEENISIWAGIKSAFSGTTTTQSNHPNLPDEIYVWYCLVDYVLYHVLPKNYESEDTARMINNYVKRNWDQQESIRVATHNTIRFIAEVVPYMSLAPDSSSVDRSILKKQMAITSSEETSSSNKYRDLVDVFNKYWKFRKGVVDDIVSKMQLPEMILLKEQLLNIVSTALDKNVDEDLVLMFFRTYEEFLINLNEVPFDWFIKDLPEVDMQGIISSKQIESVDNKLKDTVNATYRVMDPKNFATFCTSLGDKTEVPKHYVIETVKTLLVQVESQLRKESWTLGECLTEKEQLSTACDLLSALQQTLLFMKEQPEYASFALFYDESVKPFASLIETSSSLLDFSSRVQLLKQSYWFFRKQNDIDIDKALELYKKYNSQVDADLLKKLYQRYSEYFEKYMQASIEKDIHEVIKQMVDEVIPQHKNFTTWDSNFKQHEVPQILAGLAAVWSILVSKDVSSTGKYLSPHCIQILCVLRLLSSDKVTSGIDKHLAQVLTGQGKSLILALVAAFLALTGHKVDIGCYSRYLVERDRDNFNTFYSMFNVLFDVVYETLDVMMEKFISPKVNGQTKGLRELVKELIKFDGEKQQSALVPVDYSKSVLLIDEVDVFFTKNFYGNTYVPAFTLVIKGIDEIQEYIWKIVSEQLNILNYVIQFVWSFINARNFQELNTFINSKHNYKLPTNNCELKTYTNRQLFDEHLLDMVKCAIHVSKGSLYWPMYVLSPLGIIMINVNGEYVANTFYQYYNVFSYFRLKKNNFVPQVHGIENYGYLNIGCGSISYAMLPKNYPLIVGVTGTLTDLNAYEKQSIDKMYGIKKLSVVPSFFGGSNLQYDTSSDLRIQSSVPTWQQYLFSQANQMVSKNRAILIFFETDVEIDAFKSAYGGKFDRLNVLTENTFEKEKYINEAGIARTVTLATRGMGRGVDYKSSVIVEKNGGVHVIQTFFSMDIKEETQIKGRTARQDNKGSYEIVLCREKMHSSLELLTDASYSSLTRKRQELAFEYNRRTSEAIEKNKQKHNLTLNYLKSFFSG